MNKETEEKIWNYADGMLSESEKGEIEKLLDENEECRLLLMEIRKIREVISGMNPPQSSEKIFETIMIAYKRHYGSVKSYRPEVNKKLILFISSFLVGAPMFILVMTILKFSIDMSSILNAIQGNLSVTLLILLNVIFAARFIWLKSALKQYRL